MNSFKWLDRNFDFDPDFGFYDTLEGRGDAAYGVPNTRLLTVFPFKP